MKKITIFIIASLMFASQGIGQLVYQKVNGNPYINSFGADVVIEDDLAIVPSKTSTSGKIYVYRNNGGTWSAEQTISGGSYFGWGSTSPGTGSGVAIENGKIFVGQGAVNDGNVYVYSYNGTSWEIEQTIYNEDDVFGKFISVDGDIMLVHSIINIHQYKFNGTEWVEENTLPSWGENLYVKGNTIAIKEDNDSTYAPNNSAVIIYNYNSGVIDSIQKINVSTLDTNSQFGGDIAIENDLMVITAEEDYNHTYGVNNAGRIFIYNLVGGLWVLSETMETDQVPDNLNGYGCSVAINDGKIYVGDISPGWNIGRVQLLEYDGTSWQRSNIIPSIVDDNDYYGTSVSMNGRYLMVGSPGTNNGSAYFIDLCSCYGPQQEYDVCAGDSVQISGSYYNSTFTETLANSVGCDSLVVHHITTISLPTVTANGPADGYTCAGDSINLFGTGTTGNIYTWDNGVSDAVGFVPSSTQLYTVTATNGSCSNTDTITIEVKALPEVQANASNTALCEGEPVTLYGTNNTNYTWNNSVSDSVEFIPTETTVYTVSVSDSLCSNTDTISVFVYPYPEQPTISSYGNQLFSSSTEGNQWYFTSVLLPGETDQFLTPQTDGEYFVEVTENGCSTMSEGFTYTSTSISNIEDNGFSIFPNPATKFININIGNRSIESIKINNELGEIVKQINRIDDNNIKIDVSDLRNGIYFITVKSNNYTKVKKLIIN